jgi:hypothetical protein
MMNTVVERWGEGSRSAEGAEGAEGAESDNNRLKPHKARAKGLDVTKHQKPNNPDISEAVLVQMSEVTIRANTFRLQFELLCCS